MRQAGGAATTTAADGECATVDQPAPRADGGATAPEDPLDAGTTYSLVVETNCGSFTITLDQASERLAIAAEDRGDEDARADALRQFERWFNDATNAAVNEANAMTLATADGEARSLFGESTIGDVDGDGVRDIVVRSSDLIGAGASSQESAVTAWIAVKRGEPRRRIAMPPVSTRLSRPRCSSRSVPSLP